MQTRKKKVLSFSDTTKKKLDCADTNITATNKTSACTDTNITATKKTLGLRTY
jgi:hypothetical protein